MIKRKEFSRAEKKLENNTASTYTLEISPENQQQTLVNLVWWPGMLARNMMRATRYNCASMRVVDEILNLSVIV